MNTCPEKAAGCAVTEIRPQNKGPRDDLTADLNVILPNPAGRFLRSCTPGRFTPTRDAACRRQVGPTVIVNGIAGDLDRYDPVGGHNAQSRLTVLFIRRQLCPFCPSHHAAERGGVLAIRSLY